MGRFWGFQEQVSGWEGKRGNMVKEDLSDERIFE